MDVAIHPDAKLNLVSLVVVQCDEERVSRHNAADFLVNDFQQVIQVQGGADGTCNPVEQRQAFSVLACLHQAHTQGIFGFLSLDGNRHLSRHKLHQVEVVLVV